MNYLEFLSKYGYSHEIVNIAKGHVDVPEFTFKAPVDSSFGFPPVLIPLWSEGSWPGYIGIAKHWFGDHTETFVQFFSGESSIIEVARNLDQLKAWMVFDFLCNVPDSNQVGRFAESIGFCREDEVENIFSECADISDLAGLDFFKENLPSVLRNGEKFGTPDWWLPSSGIDEIRRLVSLGKFEQAWLQLNSGVFNKLEIVEILDLLSIHVERKTEFQDLMYCWSNANL